MHKIEEAYCYDMNMSFFSNLFKIFLLVWSSRFI